MDDLISRQAAIEVIDAVFPVDPIKSEYAQGIAVGAALAKTYVEQLPSVKRHGWNCEEHIENDIVYWDDLEGFHKAEEVLAWMPLPEPYKDKHED